MKFIRQVVIRYSASKGCFEEIVLRIWRKIAILNQIIVI